MAGPKDIVLRSPIFRNAGKATTQPTRLGRLRSILKDLKPGMVFGGTTGAIGGALAGGLPIRDGEVSTDLEGGLKGSLVGAGLGAGAGSLAHSRASKDVSSEVNKAVMNLRERMLYLTGRDSKKLWDMGTPEKDIRKFIGSMGSHYRRYAQNLMNDGTTSLRNRSIDAQRAGIGAGILGGAGVAALRYGSDEQPDPKEKESQMTQVNSLVEKLSVMNLTGRDNRTPFVGGTQFPTEGSKSFAKNLHDKSTDKAEVGPAPLMGKMEQTKMAPLGLNQPSTKGSHTISLDFQQKTGGAMRDPLDEFVEKRAMVLEDNVDAMEKSFREKSKRLAEGTRPKDGSPPELHGTPQQSRPSDFVGTPAEDKKREEEKLLKEMFTHYPSGQASVG